MKFYCSGILFDNDGVLVDSHVAAKAAWDVWALEYYPGYDLDKAKNAGRRAEDMVREMVAHDLFEVANNRINELEQETAHLTVPIIGARESYWFHCRLVYGQWLLQEITTWAEPGWLPLVYPYRSSWVRRRC